jgi:hypothetical protein
LAAMRSWQQGKLSTKRAVAIALVEERIHRKAEREGQK